MLPAAALAAGRALEGTAAGSITGAGLLSLLLLPPLLLISVLVSAPLAVPVAIGIGYLPLARAIEAGDLRRANLLGALVIGVLLAWLSIHLVLGGAASAPGLAAALLAPLVAAAPAVLRFARAPRGEAGPPDPQQTIRLRLSCLEDLAPSDPILVLQRRGTVLGATGAARRILPSLSDASERPIASVFSAEDTARVLGAMERCGNGEAVVIGLEGGGKHAPLEAALSRCGDGAIAMRLRDASEERPAQSAKRVAPAAPDAAALPVADIGKALEFAFDRAERPAAARRASLSRDGTAQACCDTQFARHILCRILDAALNRVQTGGHIQVEIRRLRGVVLVRVAWAAGTSDVRCAGPDGAPDIASLRGLAEAAGGTLVAGTSGPHEALTLRLPAAITAKDEVDRDGDRSHDG